MPELRQLEYFAAVCEHRSLSAAARYLYVAQPTLSEQMKNLEQELRCSLLVRHAKGVDPTPAGETLLQHAKAILSHVGEIRRLFAEAALPAGSQEEILLGAVSGPLNLWLPEALHRFRSLHPATDLKVTAYTSPDILDRVRGGKLHLGIINLGITTDLRGLTVTPLAEEEMFAAIPRDHPLAGCTPFTMTHLSSEPLILFPPHHALREVVEECCRQSGFIPRVVMESGRVEMICRSVESGIGLSVVPGMSVRMETFSNLLLRRIAGPVRPRRLLAMVSRSGEALSPALDSLCKMVSESGRNQEEL